MGDVVEATRLMGGASPPVSAREISGKGLWHRRGEAFARGVRFANTGVYEPERNEDVALDDFLPRAALHLLENRSGE
jgi:hypothetical protein